MNKGIKLIIMIVLFASALTGEYFLAMHYYPEGCCSSTGAFAILFLMIGSMVLFLYGVLRVFK
jgi:hypothetical protein